MPKGSERLIDPTEYMTLVEAAEYIGTSKQSLSKACKVGTLKSIAIGRTILIHKQDAALYKKTRQRGRPKKHLAS